MPTSDGNGKGHASNGKSGKSDTGEDESSASSPVWPQTVDEAVARTLQGMPAEDPLDLARCQTTTLDPKRVRRRASMDTMVD